MVIFIKLELSTRALKPDSLDTDPRSGFNVISRNDTQTMSIALLDPGRPWLRHWIIHTVPHAALFRIEAVWRQSGLWIRIPDPHRTRIQGSVWRVQLNLAEWRMALACAQGLIILEKCARSTCSHFEEYYSGEVQIICKFQVIHIIFPTLTCIYCSLSIENLETNRA